MKSESLKNAVRASILRSCAIAEESQCAGVVQEWLEEFVTTEVDTLRRRLYKYACKSVHDRLLSWGMLHMRRDTSLAQIAKQMESYDISASTLCRMCDPFTPYHVRCRNEHAKEAIFKALEGKGILRQTDGGTVWEVVGHKCLHCRLGRTVSDPYQHDGRPEYRSMTQSLGELQQCEGTWAEDQLHRITRLGIQGITNLTDQDPAYHQIARELRLVAKSSNINDVCRDAGISRTVYSKLIRPHKYKYTLSTAAFDRVSTYLGIHKKHLPDDRVNVLVLGIVRVSDKLSDFIRDHILKDSTRTGGIRYWNFYTVDDIDVETKFHVLVTPKPNEEGDLRRLLSEDLNISQEFQPNVVWVQKQQAKGIDATTSFYKGYHRSRVRSLV